MTKKNRLAEATASEKSKTPDPNDVEVDETEPGPNDSKPAEGEGGNVGEVRRKVEKLTHEEGAGGEVGGPDEAAPNGDDGGKEVVIENPSGDHQMDKADAGNDSGEWVEIDKSEVEADVPVEGDGLKRKNLERSESSFVQGAGEIEGAGVKRQKDTPSVRSHPHLVIYSAEFDVQPKPDALSKPEEPPKKPQTSFSAFATTASPFAAVRSAAPFATAPTSTSTPTKPSPSPFATSGFGSYSSTFSPFGSKKAAPPPNPFDKDGGKDKDEEAEAGPSKSTFGDILTSGKHVEEEDEGEEQKRHMTEQEGRSPLTFGRSANTFNSCDR